MLAIVVPGREFWDEKKEEFIRTKETTLYLEHSLLSISKWEAKWHISFIEDEKTNEQLLDYIPCMSLKGDIDPMVLMALTRDNMREIDAYLENPMTATTVKDPKRPPRSRQKVTSELIYYYMIQFGIPFEFEKWHFNRLITLIRVCSAEKAPGKKMTAQEQAKYYRELNNARRAKYHTRG